MSVKKGLLYLVATPIGNLGDLSSRAKDTLQQVNLIAAEDTRHTQTLLHHFAISTPMLSLHKFNESEVTDRIIQQLCAGESVALVSNAGTPLISDPGFPLVQACHQQQIQVSPIPGPCALITALSASGLSANRFAFEGFLQRSQAARISQMEELKHEPRTLIFYESGHRIVACLEDLLEVFGPKRSAVIGRELTKLHETILTGTLNTLLETIKTDPMQQKGEFVLVVGGFLRSPDNALDPPLKKLLATLLTELPLKQAVGLLTKATGVKRNLLYQEALKMKTMQND